MGTPPLECSLLALRPPGNVERTINEVRSRLFARTLAFSTQALPPSLHLAFVGPDTAADVADSLPQELIPPPTIGSAFRVSGTAVVSCTLDGNLSSWIAGLPRVPAPELLPAPCAGLYLGAGDLCSSLGGNQSADGALDIPELREITLPHRIAVFTLELVAIRVRDVDQIWLDVEWDVVWKKRIKFRGQAVERVAR